MSKKVIPVLAIVILSVTFSQLEISEAVVVSDLEKAGYKFIGQIEDTGPARGVRAASSLYFISEVHEIATAAQAASRCRDFGGQLIAPLNSVQIGYIRQFLDDAGRLTGQNYWTAGQNVDHKWWWRTTGKQIASPTLNGNFSPICPVSGDANGQCLSLAGALGSFGFCAPGCLQLHAYICEVNA